MVRNVISIMVGLVVGFIVVGGIQMINYGLFPLPEGIDMQDKELMIQHVKSLPSLAFFIVIFSHIAGSFISALVAVKIADSHLLHIALGLALFFTVMGVVNLVTIPHPLWFSIIDTLVYLPSAYIGYKVGAPQ